MGQMSDASSSRSDNSDPEWSPSSGWSLSTSGDSQDEDSAGHQEPPPKRVRALVAILTHSLQGVGVEELGPVDKRKLHLPRLPRWGDPQSDDKLHKWRWSTLCRSHVWHSLIQSWAHKTRMEHSWEYEAFRKEFGLPRKLFDYLVDVTQKEANKTNSPYKTFAPQKRFGDKRRGPPAGRMEYKIAAVLKYLKSGSNLTDIAKLAGVSAECIRPFFHEWLRFLMLTEYHKHVYLPSGQELQHALKTYANLGFPGAAFSTDGVHVYWNKCPAPWTWIHSNHEKDGPTRVFNPSVTHNGIVIYIPPSLPGRNNDKTGAKYHALLCKLRDKKLWQDVPFELYDAQGRKYTATGLYSITDGGYHQWRCTQSPSKYAGELWHGRQSKRLESVRKDVECVFGKIFARFRIFQKPLLFQQVETIEHAFRLCAMLHNMICRYDGLDTIGECDTDWKSAPLAMDDLNIVLPSLDELGAECATQSDFATQSDALAPTPLQLGANPAAVERDPEWSILRSMLITHYMIAWQKREIKWKKTGVELGLTFRSSYGSWRLHGEEEFGEGDAEDEDGEVEEEEQNEDFDL